MKKVLCFGEVLMRISPLAGGGWIKQNNLPVYIGGAELNVATALACWNVPVQYCTAMPDNYLAKDIDTYIQQQGVDTTPVNWSGNRVGIYYLQQGADLKNAGVIYDRAYSSFYELKPGMINWDEILKDVSWFHFTAISPALNGKLPAVCKEALEAASAKGITISIDLNYRAKLWQYGKKPVDVMPELAQYCDVIMGNIWAANTLLGISIDKEVEVRHNKQSYIDHSTVTSEAIMKAYPRCKHVAHSFRFDHGDGGINYYTTLYTNNHLHVSKDYTIDKVTDKIGSGDCFMGGLIYGLYNNYTAEDVINFATAAAVGKLNEFGDATHQTVEQVKKIMQQHD
ncbi:MAG: sugar kinase [Flavipsychrobacter sp.]|nr:sugar kinase [Flavipsychrobacter sp.]